MQWWSGFQISFAGAALEPGPIQVEMVRMAIYGYVLPVLTDRVVALAPSVRVSRLLTKEYNS